MRLFTILALVVVVLGSSGCWVTRGGIFDSSRRNQVAFTSSNTPAALRPFLDQPLKTPSGTPLLLQVGVDNNVRIVGAGFDQSIFANIQDDGNGRFTLVEHFSTWTHFTVGNGRRASRVEPLLVVNGKTLTVSGRWLSTDSAGNWSPGRPVGNFVGTLP